ncbi:MAG: elongation factor Ts [Actinobacteria bacterium]|nr:elongation factor Ts [Actinomycetota bacterium]
MMECKAALGETGGDLDEAMVVLRKKGAVAAQKKSSRATREGMVDSYIHAGGKIGVLVEVGVETDFVARGDDFRTFCHELAMQVAASAPRWVTREQVPAELIEQERAIYADQVKDKPEHVVEKIVNGKLDKFFQEYCLMEQPWVRDTAMSIEQLRTDLVGKIRENVEVRRFARFQLGEVED